MTYLLALLLACATSSEPTPNDGSADRLPFCSWVEDTCFSPPIALTGELVQVVSCTDTDDGYTICAPQGWRIYPDGSWEPSTCTGDYWRACITQ